MLCCCDLQTLNNSWNMDPANYAAGPGYMVLDLWWPSDVLVFLDPNHMSGVWVMLHSWHLGEKGLETKVRSSKGVWVYDHSSKTWPGSGKPTSGSTSTLRTSFFQKTAGHPAQETHAQAMPEEKERLSNSRPVSWILMVEAKGTCVSTWNGLSPKFLVSTVLPGENTLSEHETQLCVRLMESQHQFLGSDDLSKYHYQAISGNGFMRTNSWKWVNKFYKNSL